MRKELFKLIFAILLTLSAKAFTFGSVYWSLRFLTGFEASWSIDVLFGLCSMVAAFIVLDYMGCWAREFLK